MFHRLTKMELDDIFTNAGITKIQKQILRLRYFDEHDKTVIAICLDLGISHSKFYQEIKKAKHQIDRYLEQKRIFLQTK